MAEFATEYDKLLADPTFRIIVSGITGIRGGSVTGIITDDLDISGGNEFNNPLASQAVASLQETLAKASSIAERIANSMGAGGMGAFSLRTVEQSMDFWVGSKKPPFRQSMIFVAQKATDDVRIPVANLYKTVFPKLQGFGLTDTVTPPLGYVPYSGGDVRAVKGTLDIAIGRWFRGVGLIMTAVNFKFSKQTIANGTPLFASGTIEFQPFREISWKEMCAFMGISVEE